jgi:hypothetical protein
MPGSRTPESFQDFALACLEGHEQVVLGSGDTYWRRHGRWAMVRVPMWSRSLPTRDELVKVLRQGRVAVASYLRPVDVAHPANGLLYLFEGQRYGLENCRSTARKSLRFSQNRLEFKEITVQELMAHGYQCFRDTRLRNGLSDCHRQEFLRTIERKALLPNLLIQAAWRGEVLAAFLISYHLGSQGEMLQHCSLNEMKRFDPNEMLYFRTLETLVNERGVRLVSAGTSSLQHGVNLQGLHWFKTKMGLVAHEIHRSFYLHSFVQLLLNNGSYQAIKLLSGLLPSNKLVRKGLGMMALALGQVPHLHNGQERMVGQMSTDQNGPD